MEEWRRYLDQKDMTPEERMERIVGLLAIGVVRLIKKESDKKAAAGTTSKEKTEELNTLISATASQPEPHSIPLVKGRIPFGQRMGDKGRVVNESEAIWIRRIQELTIQGYSSEKIAKQLNQEDHESKRAGKWSRTAVWRILKKFTR